MRNGSHPCDKGATDNELICTYNDMHKHRNGGRGIGVNDGLRHINVYTYIYKRTKSASIAVLIQRKKGAESDSV